MSLHELAPSHFDLVAGWLSRRENYQWLEFAGRGQTLSAMNLRLMVQRDIHCLRVFTPSNGNFPIGLVALSDIAPLSRTASLWYVLGEKAYEGQGDTTRAVLALIDHGFAHLGLQALHAWAVSENQPSTRVLEKSGFRLVGRQRRCHYLDGNFVDRLLFDLVATEHRGN